MEKAANRLIIAALIAATALPTLANAEIAAAYHPTSKTEAILGGQPSALAAIMASQSGQVSAITSTAAVSPASPGAMFRPAVMPLRNAIASMDQPDVFNSVALSLRSSPLDRRWRAVATARASGGAAAYAATLRGTDALDQVDAINRYVNARVRFVDDSVQFGSPDRWMAASETLARGRGDCEDFAIAKRAMLRSAGFADRDLYLVVLKDLSRRSDHAVLVVRVAGRFLVLDNGTDRIVDSASIEDYKPILTFTENSVYTHGYRRSVTPPMVLASATPAPVERILQPAWGEQVQTPIAAAMIPTAISALAYL